MTIRSGIILVAASSLLLAACELGPNYHRPSAPVPTAFKELKGWSVAKPQDQIDRGAWWSVYDDPILNGLEDQVRVSNQNLKQAEAAYRAAVAAAVEARAGLFPTLGATASGQRSAGSSGGGTTTGGKIVSSFSADADVSWAPDIWGKVRRATEAGIANAQASAADLAAATLSAQGALATDYFELRAQDSLYSLLDDTANAYRRALQITRNQYDAGTAARSDIISAETQLDAVEAQKINVGVQRAQLEHAIALLTGQPPADLTIAPAPLSDRIPVTPPGVPSTLLERRPDIAAAERQMQQENAAIGVAIAGFYPTITLSGLAGFASAEIGGLLALSNGVWSIGASAAETLYSGGALTAAEQLAKANYDAAVANYRQTVLTAFQQVEDQLAALRILEQEAAAEEKAVQSAHQAVTITLNEYRAGTVAYTSVITAQAIELADEQAALTIRENRIVASATLIQDLGGGWNTAELPAQDKIIEPGTEWTP
jgi:NodT family efflux transporter outer membrane factor (OMF) lipoprotein